MMLIYSLHRLIVEGAATYNVDGFTQNMKVPVTLS